MQERPFFRIARPFIDRNYTSLHGYKYLYDDRYANDKFELIRAYYNLENDLLRLFEYVEPSDRNLNTFSFRSYELLLRACTEFESNAKKILVANNYKLPKGQKTYNIKNYCKINNLTRLNDYKLFINTWSDGKKELKPFSEWSSKENLFWYKDYSNVKHNRHENFHLASLNNVINAVGSVFCILYAQFSILIFSLNQNTGRYEDDPNTFEQWSSNDSLFSIIPSQNWNDEDFYNFNWDNIKYQDPFIQHPF